MPNSQPLTNSLTAIATLMLAGSSNLDHSEIQRYRRVSNQGDFSGGKGVGFFRPDQSQHA